MIHLLSLYRRYRARIRLQEIVDANRSTFECQDRARRRAAAKMGIARKQGVA